MRHLHPLVLALVFGILCLERGMFSVTSYIHCEHHFVLSDDFSKLGRLLLVSFCILRGQLSTLPSVLLGI